VIDGTLLTQRRAKFRTTLREKWELVRCCCLCSDRSEIRRRFAHSRRFLKPTTAVKRLRERPSVCERVGRLYKPKKLAFKSKKKIMHLEPNNIL